MRKIVLALLLTLVLVLCAVPIGVFAGESGENLVPQSDAVAKVGSTEYATIEEALAVWTTTNNSVLTLLADVTLPDVVELKSTESHTLNLGEFTMTSAKNKSAIEIKQNDRTNAGYCLTVNATTGGITIDGTSTKNACIYYNKSSSTRDRPIITINGGVYTGTYYSLFFNGNSNTNCPQIVINDGTFYGTYVWLVGVKTTIRDGYFDGQINLRGGSSNPVQITGGEFKKWHFNCIYDKDTKFAVGSVKSGTTPRVYMTGLYVDENNWLNVGGAPITAPGTQFEASTQATYWHNALIRSSATEYGSNGTYTPNVLFWETLETAMANSRANTSGGKVTVHIDSYDLTGSTFKGSLMLPDTDHQFTVTFEEGTTPTWKMGTNVSGELAAYKKSVENGVVTRIYSSVKNPAEGNGTVAVCDPTEQGKYALKATAANQHYFAGWFDADDNLVSSEDTYEFTAFGDSPLTAVFLPKETPVAEHFNFTPPSELTYDNTAKTATVTAKDHVIGMGNVSVWYLKDGSSTLTSAAPIEAGTYTVKITVNEGERYLTTTGYLTDDSWTFTIDKAEQSAPVVSKEDETILNKNDGKLTGVTSGMEYRAADETDYTPITGDTIEGLKSGTYYVRYAEDDNHNASLDTEVTVDAGRKMKFTLPQNPEGYSVETSVAEYDWHTDATVYFELGQGYSKTEDFKYMVNGVEVELVDGTYYTLNDLEEDCVITVEGVKDITAPTGVVKFNDNTWNSFREDISFNLIYNETQEMTIDAADAGSGIDSVSYYLADDMLTEEALHAVTDWEDYIDAVKLEPNGAYVVYAKITDKAGNVSYVNSEGIIVDNFVPVLNGIEDNKTYYDDLKVQKTEPYKSATLDGKEMDFDEDNYSSIPADNKEHIVIVTDYAGNKNIYNIKVMKTYSVTFKADGEVVTTVTAGHGLDVDLPTIPEKEGYNETAPMWDHDGKNITEDTVINAIYIKNGAEQDLPVTGDANNIILWITVMFISIVAVTWIIVVFKKKTFTK